MFTTVDTMADYASDTPSPALCTAFAAHRATARPEELPRAIECRQDDGGGILTPRKNIFRSGWYSFIRLSNHERPLT